MIDADYLLAPVAAAWLLARCARPGARGRRSSHGRPALRRAPRNARRGPGRQPARSCSRARRAFAADPTVAHLIALKPGLARRRLARQRRRASAAAATRTTSTRCWSPRRSPRRRSSTPADCLRRTSAPADRALFARAAQMARTSGTRRRRPSSRSRIPHDEAPPARSPRYAAAAGAVGATRPSRRLGRGRAALPRARARRGRRPGAGHALRRGLRAALRRARPPTTSTRPRRALSRPFPAGLMTDAGHAGRQPRLLRGPGAAGDLHAATPTTARWSGRGSRPCSPRVSPGSSRRRDLPAAVRDARPDGAADSCGPRSLRRGRSTPRSCGRGTSRTVATTWPPSGPPPRTPTSRMPRSCGARCTWRYAPRAHREVARFARGSERCEVVSE